MKYRITFASNPRSILVIFLVLILPAAGIVCLLFLPPFVGIVVILVGGYVAYQLVKFLINILTSRIETSEQGMKFTLNRKETTFFAWVDLTHAGYCTQAKNRPFIFLYADEDDRLMTVPDEYEGFSNLIDEIKDHIEIETVELAPGETAGRYLQSKLGIKTDKEDDESEEDEEN